MPQSDRLLGMYLHLAQASRLRRQPMVRDKLLVLSGVQAVEMGLPQIAAVCRRQILLHNPWHLVRRWPNLADALQDDAFQDYLKQLLRRYSPEKAEHLLHKLGIEMARERQAYFSDHEYAAALLGATADELEQAAQEVASGIDPQAVEVGPLYRHPEVPQSRRSRRGSWMRRQAVVARSSGWLMALGPVLLGVLVLLVLLMMARGLFR